jgi:hypothetical protein
MAETDEGMIEPPVVQTAQTTDRGIHSIFLVNNEHKLAESIAHLLAERYEIPYVHINSILESMSGSTNFSNVLSKGMDEYADTGVLLHGFPMTGEHIAACTNFPKAKIVALQFVSKKQNDEQFLHASMQIKTRIDLEKYVCIEYDESKDVLTNLETLGPLIGSSKAEEVAAIKIQAIKRGQEVRRQKAQKASSATKIQAGVRGRQIRKREAEKKTFLEAQKVDIFFSKIVNVATDPRTATSVTSIFSKNNSMKMHTAKKKWMALDSAKKPALYEFQQLLADEIQWKDFQALFQSKNGQGELLIDLLAFKNVVENHGGALKEERGLSLHILKNRLLVMEFMTRKDEIKEIFDQYSNENGVLTMLEFKSVLKKRTELWGYKTEKHMDGLHQAAIFDEIDNIYKEDITWKQFHSFMDKVAHSDSRDVADKMVERAAIADARKRKLAATKKTAAEKNVGKVEEIAPVPTRKAFQRGVPRDEDVEQQIEASSRKEMLILTLQKYRRGLNRLFQFYSKANMGDFNGRLFEKIAEEHSGVSLLMFRTMCKDLGLVIGKETMNIITAARKRHARSSLTSGHMPYEDIVSDSRPYTDMKRIEKCFLKKSTLLSGVSAVSHGKGILTLSQFVSAFANVAVDMLDVFPWNERYVEEWRKVDAVFSRLDLNNPSQLNNRIRGRGGFGVGDGDLKGHDGSLPNMQKHCFSFPLNLPGDPSTPEPTIPENVKPVRRCREPGSGIIGGKISSGRIVPLKSTKKSNDSRMIVSLASEFGIDDTVINFGNPYGASTGYSGALSSMLSDLNLTYGVDEDRLHLEDLHKHKGRRTYEAALSARKLENGTTFVSPKREHDHAWAMTWGDLETNQSGQEKPRNESFNAIARQRRSELERPNVGYRARNGGYSGARNLNVRASPSKAYEQRVRREYGDLAPIEPSRNFNRDQNSYVPKPPKTLAKRPSPRLAVNTDVGKRTSARTPGRLVSKSEFNSSRKQNKPTRRNRQAGHVAFGGRPSPSSTVASPSRR